MTVIDTAEMYADGAATHTLPRALITARAVGVSSIRDNSYLTATECI